MTTRWSDRAKRNERQMSGRQLTRVVRWKGTSGKRSTRARIRLKRLVDLAVLLGAGSVLLGQVHYTINYTGGGGDKPETCCHIRVCGSVEAWIRCTRTVDAPQRGACWREINAAGKRLN